MGIIIFLIALVVEIAFAALCIITKSNNIKVRRIIRIAGFFILVLSILLPVIDWSFRYYALTALWFVLAVTAIVALMSKKEEKKDYKALRIILIALGMSVLIFASTLPAIIFPEYKMVEVSGEYKVASSTYTYVDVNRLETFTDTGEFRKLNVEIWYPLNINETYPLIIYSHGGISNKSSNESLYNELASSGYVVCSIDHTYHSLSTTDNDGQTILIDSGYMQELNSENARSDRQQSYEYYQKWMNIRTADISFVIDYFLSAAVKEEADAVYRLVDTSKIGVMGHSLGGSAALGIGRMRDDVSAVIALESPFMCDIEGVKDDEFVFVDEAYPSPVLNVYSDSAWNHLGEWPQYAQNDHLLSDTETTAFNIYISGVGHFSLTDLALSSPILTRLLNGQKSTTDAEYCLTVINKVCVEFYDFYLKGEGESKPNISCY